MTTTYEYYNIQNLICIFNTYIHIDATFAYQNSKFGQFIKKCILLNRQDQITLLYYTMINLNCA